MKDPLRILVFKGESGLFVAICLEHDFGAQSGTVEGAVLALEEAYRARIRIAEERGEQPFQHGRRAPEQYWARYESAAPVEVSGATRAQVRAAA